MDRSNQYAQVMSNLDSAYNGGMNRIPHSTIYMPISSSTSFSSQQTRSNPKFNLDLYHPHDYHSESFDYPSPSSSVIIHHHPVHSPSPSPSQAISKLRQINDELCYTLARCDINSQSQPSQSPQPHHHVHHYPISRESSPSPPPREEDSSSTESEPTLKKRNARITYKAHLPRRSKPLAQVDQLLLTSSDVYSRGDPMTVDLYPTRDQGFVRKIRNRPDNQSPWLADTSPIRRNSYSESSTYRTPRAPNYDNKLIQPNSRLASSKERPRSTSGKSRRFRPDTAPNPLRQSAVSFSTTVPVWRPSGSIKRRKFIGSNAPPTKPKPPPSEPTWNPAGTPAPTKTFRAFDPVSTSTKKLQEPVWHPPSKKSLEKPRRYFEPTTKPEMTVPIPKQTTPFVRKKSTIASADPKLKARIANTQSKVKSVWEEPTPTVTKPKPPIVPRPVKKPTTTIPPKIKEKSIPAPPIVPVKKVLPAPPIKTDTGRSSLTDVPTKPMFESTPRNQSIAEDPDDLFDEETQLSEPSKTPSIPHAPPQIEITPTKLPKTTVPQPGKETKATIKDGVLIHGNDEDNRTPSPKVNNNDDEEEPPLHDQSLPSSPIPHNRKTPSPKPDNVSVIDDEAIEENSAANDTVKDTDDDDVVAPSSPKIPPRQKERSPLPTTAPVQPTASNDSLLDDFF